MKWWYAAFCALCLLPPQPATAADDLNSAAREVARKTAAFLGRGEAVTVNWRNPSSLNPAELGRARVAFEAGLREAGTRVADAAAAEARITISENPSQYLLVEELRRGEDRQVWVASWKRTAPAVTPRPSLSLEKKLVWEQDEPILDVAFSGDVMIVLSPGKLTWVRPAGPSPIALPAARTPRDARGRIRTSGPGFEAFLPGLACRFSAGATAVDCRPSNDPWVIESGSRALLVAEFEATRNFFDGHVATQTGVRKTVAPFYSAAAVEENGKPLWLLAMVDGRTQIFDTAFEPVGAIPGWGSDIAGTDARCGGGSQVLATRPGDAHELDAIQAFTILNRGATSLAAALDFPGPVTALWTSNGSSAVAVVRDLTTGKYAAYLITVACGA